MRGEAFPLHTTRRTSGANVIIMSQQNQKYHITVDNAISRQKWRLSQANRKNNCIHFSSFSFFDFVHNE